MTDGEVSDEVVAVFIPEGPTVGFADRESSGRRRQGLARDGQVQRVANGEGLRLFRDGQAEPASGGECFDRPSRALHDHRGRVTADHGVLRQRTLDPHAPTADGLGQDAVREFGDPVRIKGEPTHGPILSRSRDGVDEGGCGGRERSAPVDQRHPPDEPRAGTGDHRAEVAGGLGDRCR